MDEVFNALVGYLPSIVFCVLVYAAVLLQRKVIEKAWPKIKENWVWREIALPAGPYGTGFLLAALIRDWPFPEAFQGSFWLHVSFGVFLGAISGFVYKAFWAYLKHKKEDFEKLVGNDSEEKIESFRKILK